MRPVWKGSISFGLVTIPVAVHNATKHEELKFRMLRESDLSPINYKRVAEADGKEVPWEQIVKGYEYEKGKFVVLKEDDFKRVDLEATDTIDIMDFVDLDEINPIFFYKPYYLEPQRGGGAAYALLRDVLAKSNKTGIAKIVIRNRQHLASVKANGSLLVLELMHFAHEIVTADAITVPADKKIGAREVEMATTLVTQMTSKWNPERYTDDYTSALMKVIDQKVESGGKELPTAKTHHRAPTNVIDLVAVLQQSLQETGRGGAAGGTKSPPAAKHRKSSEHRKSTKRRAHKKAA